MSCQRPDEPELAPPDIADGPLSFRIVLASDPRSLSVVRSAVAELAAVTGFENGQCGCITLAVDEALSNVIRHAYKNQPDREIEVLCRADAGGLEFTLMDVGEAPDLSRICGRPLDSTSPGGRGTHLIRQIMDDVSYERISGRNRLTLKKYLPSAGGKAGGNCEE